MISETMMRWLNRNIVTEMKKVYDRTGRRFIDDRMQAEYEAWEKSPEGLRWDRLLASGREEYRKGATA